MSVHDDVDKQVARTTDAGKLVLALACVVGVGLALFNYLQPHNGIGHTWGALVVVASTALVFAAALVLTAVHPLNRALRLLLNLGLLLGMVGTALAAYFLESYGLMGLMGLGLAGWIIQIAFGRASTKAPARTHRGAT